MLSHTLRVESLRIAPHRNNQFIPPNLKHLSLRDFLRYIAHTSFASQPNALQRIINRFLNSQRPLIKVYTIRPALEELRSLLVSFPRTRGFQCAAELERSDGC